MVECPRENLDRSANAEAGGFRLETPRVMFIVRRTFSESPGDL